MERAEAVGLELRGVGLEAAHGLLGEQKDLKTFLNSLPLMRLYWSDLDRGFSEFLNGLEPGNETEAFTLWKERLKRAARRAWNETRKSVGLEARHLKALEKAEARMSRVMKVAEEGKRVVRK